MGAPSIEAESSKFICGSARSAHSIPTRINTDNNKVFMMEPFDSTKAIRPGAGERLATGMSGVKPNLSHDHRKTSTCSTTDLTFGVFPWTGSLSISNQPGHE